MKRKSLSLALILSLVTSALMLMVVFTPTQCSAGFGDTPRAPIYIENDDFFNSDNGVNGGGTGIAADPYIIENWVIDASSATGIYIENTIAYFIIRNCLIENSRIGGVYYGIVLDNVINGRVENNTCKNNTAGIYLWISDNNTLVNNTCKNNLYGIYIRTSSNNTLTNNTCRNNLTRSIDLSFSSDNNILDNNICESSNYGIFLYSASDNNTMINNYLFNNTSDNAYDDNINNWDNNGEGNYWGDWQPQTHPDANGDGIIDTPRPIAGGANQDNYPRMYITVTITSPSTNYSPRINEGIEFVPSASNIQDNPMSYSWDFGDGGTSSEQNPSYQYSSTGTYTATVIATDGHASADASVVLYVTSEAAVPPSGGPGGPSGWVEQAAEEIEKVVQPAKNPLFQIQFFGVPIFFLLLIVGAITWTHKDRKGIHTMKGISYSIFMGVGFLLVMGPAFA